MVAAPDKCANDPSCSCCRAGAASCCFATDDDERIKFSDLFGRKLLLDKVRF
jgi:hypothetical protein